jgi:Holliday junction DNA helicase RuvB
MARPPYQVDEFVGHKKELVPLLREQDGARSRGEPQPPILLTGPSGTGKSLLARMLAKRSGTGIAKFNSTESVNEVAERLRVLSAGDIAFFDECHKLSHDVQEALYEVLDCHKIPARLGPNPAASEPIPIAALTVIFATDQPGRLLNALLKRIPTTVRLRPYPEKELKEIVTRVARRLRLLLSPQAARQLAKACNGLPRRAEHHVLKLRLYFPDAEDRDIACSDVRKYLAARGIDKHGFGKDQRQFLAFIAKNGSASLEALAGYLGVDAEYVRTQVEQPLRYRALITVGRSGRVLTRRGKAWIEKRRQPHTKHERDSGS